VSVREAICSNVAKLLREERLKQQLSLNALSERAGLSRQMVSFVEEEERNPSLDTLLRLSEALGLELDEVLRKARLAAKR
jgi:transcriptional regulator with XRE-family HTH domain